MEKAKTLFMEFYITRVKVDSNLSSVQQKKEAANQLKKAWSEVTPSALKNWKTKARKALDEESQFADSPKPKKLLGKRAHPQEETKTATAAQKRMKK